VAKQTQEQTSASGVRLVTPLVLEPNQRGVLYPLWKPRRPSPDKQTRVRQGGHRGPSLTTSDGPFFLPPARSPGNLRSPHGGFRTQSPHPGQSRTGLCQGTSQEPQGPPSPAPRSRASFLSAHPNKMRRPGQLLARGGAQGAHETALPPQGEHTTTAHRAHTAEPDKNAAQAVTPGGAGSHPVLRGSSGTSNPPQANPPYCPSRNELIFQ
jgi:CubicO group peptidase (beta-lactamase class C family)